MRNRYPGTCYRCGGHVAAGEGHFERFIGRWRTQHASCANWPNPERPGWPMFPDQEGCHIFLGPFDREPRVLLWRPLLENYLRGDIVFSPQEVEDCRLTYIGPVLTPTQITEMLAGERKALKEKSWVYAQDDGENVASNVEDLLEYNDEYEIVNVGEAAEIDDYYAFKDRDNTIHKFTTRKEAEEAIRNLGDAP